MFYAFLVGTFIFVMTMGYFFLMFFFPEWVGMSGDKTKEFLESHREDEHSSIPQQPQGQHDDDSKTH